MDLNLVRSIMTVVSLLVFVGLMAIVWYRGRNGGYDEEANLPFAGDLAKRGADPSNPMH